MNRIDKNGLSLQNGDMIDIYQTVNGQSQFVVKNAEKLDIRYLYDMRRKYEYNKEDLLSPSKITGEIEFEIIGTIY